MWQDECALTGSAASGQPDLAIDSTDYKNFEVGGQCILFQDENNYETGKVLTVTTTQITLTANLTDTWPAQTKVYPLLQARIKPVQKLHIFTPKYSEIPIFAQEVLDTDITRTVGSISGYPTYNSKDVFNTEPNWANDITAEYRHRYEQIKSFGKDFVESYLDETKIKTLFNFLNMTRAEIYALESFFDGCMGRLSPFWVPTWQADVVVTSGFGAADVTINIEDIKWTDYWEPNTVVGNYLFFRFPDESEVYRKIISATNTTITIDSSTGKALTTAELPGLLTSFLCISRFDMDEIETVYHTPDVATIEVAFSTLSDVSGD